MWDRRLEMSSTMALELWVKESELQSMESGRTPSPRQKSLLGWAIIHGFREPQQPTLLANALSISLSLSLSLCLRVTATAGFVYCTGKIWSVMLFVQLLNTKKKKKKQKANKICQDPLKDFFNYISTCPMCFAFGLLLWSMDAARRVPHRSPTQPDVGCGIDVAAHASMP